MLGLGICIIVVLILGVVAAVSSDPIPRDKLNDNDPPFGGI